MSIIRKFISWRQRRINARNRRRLTNTTPTLICSNCTGGVLYHWLGLEFRSPFINLYMDNGDFLTAMEHFDEFIKADITEDTGSDKPYPVGIGPRGERIHFMHYPDFATAKAKWIERRRRIDPDNMAVMLTNLGAGAECIGGGKSTVIQRFTKLPFKHKLIFSGEASDAPGVIHLKGYSKVENRKNIFGTQSISGRRYIDQFDYVDFINHLKDKEGV